MDIEQHELVPSHEVMDEEAVEQLCNEYEIETDQLPRITQDDAMVKQLEAEVGDVIEITRPSPTAEETTYYRVVVEA